MNNIKELHPKEKVTLLAVKVPDDFRDFAGLIGDHLYYWGKLHTQTDYPYSIQLPFDNLEYLGHHEQIDEDIWQTIVESEDGKRRGLYGTCYKDYSNQKRFAPHFNNATSSAMSFLEANEVYSVNPYPKPEFVFNRYGKSPIEFKRFEIDKQKWQQAEANTGTWVILQKL